MDIAMTDYQKFPMLLKESAKAVGAVIGMGKKFVTLGVKEIDNKLVPMLRDLIGKNTIPRVLPSYSMLLWFTIEV